MEPIEELQVLVRLADGSLDALPLGLADRSRS